MFKESEVVISSRLKFSNACLVGRDLCAEDREDLRMFEEGVSSPTPIHAAWRTAASSLQMRHALPEVTNAYAA